MSEETKPVITAIVDDVAILQGELEGLKAALAASQDERNALQGQLNILTVTNTTLETDLANARNKVNLPRLPQDYGQAYDFVAALPKEELTKAYQFGNQLRALVNERWTTGR